MFEDDLPVSVAVPTHADELRSSVAEVVFELVLLHGLSNDDNWRSKSVLLQRFEHFCAHYLLLFVELFLNIWV